MRVCAYMLISYCIQDMESFSTRANFTVYFQNTDDLGKYAIMEAWWRIVCVDRERDKKLSDREK